MEQELLKQVQRAQLEIALEIKRICEENGIAYFLDSGSLLGAARHKGFIPWDDDMDFGMMEDEYAKFIRIAPEKLPEGYALQSWDTDDGYPFAFCKVLKLGTEFVEDVFETSKKRNELYVDVFPYYPFPSDKGLQRKQKAGIQLYKHILMVQSGMTPWKRPNGFAGKAKVWMMYLPFRVLAFLVNREKAKEKYVEKLNLSRDAKSEAFFPAGVSKYGQWVIPASCFSAYTELPFEGSTFQAPVDYRLYLTRAYGDYMRLPPEDQRGNRHIVVRVKL